MNRVIDFPFLSKFQPKQSEAERILFSPECKYLLYGGAASGGKSYWLRWIALEMVLYYTAKYNIKGVQVGLFSEDYPTLKDRHVGRIKREFPDWLGQLVESKEDGLVYKLGEKYGGGKIMLRNLDDPSKYASTEFAGECVDELTKNTRETFDDLRFRLRYPGVNDSKFASASNPGGIGHAYTYQLFIRKSVIEYPPELLPEIDRFFYVPALPTDNKFTPPEYITTLKSLPEKKRKMYLEGSWEVPEGQVFDEWGQQHIRKRVVPKMAFKHFLSMDWGYSEKSAFSAHAHALIPMKTEDGEPFNRIITYQEWYGNKKSPRQWAQEILESAQCRKFARGYVDGAMLDRQTDGSESIGSSMMNYWRDQGNPFCDLERGSKDRIKRIALTHDWLSLAPDGIPYWISTDNNPNLIRTVPMLVYDENKIEDLNTKQEDHAWDDVSYFLSMMPFIKVASGGVKRSSVQAEDDVLPTFLGTIDPKAFEKAASKPRRDWKYR